MHSTKDVGDMFRVTPATIRKRISEGVLKAVKRGGKWWITTDDIISCLIAGAPDKEELIRRTFKDV